MKRHLAPTSLVVGVCILALAAFVPELLGQEKANEAVWHRYSTSAGDLTFAFPGTDILVDQDGPTTWVLYAKGGLSLSVRADRTKGAKKRFLELAERPGSDKYQGFTFDDFTGRWYRDSDNEKGIESVYFQLASTHGTYMVSGRARKSQLTNLERFFRSLRLGGKQFVNSAITDEPESKEVSRIEALQTSEKVTQALSRSTPKDLKFTDSTKSNTTNVPANDNDDELSPKYSSDLIFIRKPRPRYTNSSLIRGDSGVVKFRVTFRADGTLGLVELLQSVNKGLDARAFDALKDSKFIPAEIDGKPVDVTRIMEYAFTLY